MGEHSIRDCVATGVFISDECVNSFTSPTCA
jgi:hypothetical protein